MRSRTKRGSRRKEQNNEKHIGALNVLKRLLSISVARTCHAGLPKPKRAHGEQSGTHSPEQTESPRGVPGKGHRANGKTMARGTSKPVHQNLGFYRLCKLLRKVEIARQRN